LDSIYGVGWFYRLVVSSRNGGAFTFPYAENLIPEQKNIVSPYAVWHGQCLEEGYIDIYK